MTCDVISAFQSTLDVVLVPDVEVEFAELVLDAVVLVVEVVLLTEVMAKPPVHRTKGSALTAGPWSRFC